MNKIIVFFAAFIMQSNLLAMKSSYKRVVVANRKEWARGDAYLGGNWKANSQTINKKYDTRVLKKGLLEYCDEKTLKEIMREYPHVNFYRSNVSENSFNSIKLPNLAMEKTDAQRVKLTDKTFIDPKLKTVRLDNADLTNTKLINGSIRNVKFNGADMQYGKIIGNVRYADFSNTNLTEAQLGGRFASVLFTGAKMGGVKLLPGTDMRGASGLTMPIKELAEAKKNGCKFGFDIEAKIKAAAAWAAVKSLFR